MEQEVTGRFGDADRAGGPDGPEPRAASQPEALIPSAGDWLILRTWGLHYRQIGKVTPKLFKLSGGSQRYPTQVGQDSREIVGIIRGSESEAAKLRDAVAGADGEFNRRSTAARKDYDERVNQAREARDKAVTRLLASAMSARQGQDAERLEGDSPASATGAAGDAQ